MKIYSVEAIIIKRRNFLEKDRVLTLFSREKGKIEVLAKGARRPGSRLSFHSDLGINGMFRVHRGRTLDILTEVTPIFLPKDAVGQVFKTEKISFAFKLINKLYELNQAHKKSYEVLKKTIRDVSENDFQLTFLIFLISIICDLGLMPELGRCFECNRKFEKGEKIVFSPKGGLAHCSCFDSEDNSIGEDEIKLLRLISKTPPQKIFNSKVKTDIFEKTFLHIKSYLEWHFGKILPEKVL